LLVGWAAAGAGGWSEGTGGFFGTLIPTIDIYWNKCKMLVNSRKQTILFFIFLLLFMNGGFSGLSKRNTNDLHRVNKRSTWSDQAQEEDQSTEEGDCLGCPTKIDANSTQAMEIANRSIELLAANLGQDRERMVVSKIDSVSYQVVSGVKWSLQIEVSFVNTGGPTLPSSADVQHSCAIYIVEILDQAWASPRYTLLSFKEVEEKSTVGTESEPVEDGIQKEYPADLPIMTTTMDTNNVSPTLRSNSSNPFASSVPKEKHTEYSALTLLLLCLIALAILMAICCFACSILGASPTNGHPVDAFGMVTLEEGEGIELAEDQIISYQHGGGNISSLDR